MNSRVDYIQKARNLFGISQGELSLASGVSRVTLAQAETGYYNPSEAILSALEKGLDSVVRDRLKAIRQLMPKLLEPQVISSEAPPLEVSKPNPNARRMMTKAIRLYKSAHA